MLIKHYSEILEQAINASEKQIVDQFMGLKGAIKLECSTYTDKPCVYVPGTRSDRVLLVAHYDTVWKGAKIDLKRTGFIYHSGKKAVGIGADDRAGVAALWLLRKSGHSLLLCSDEEVGCLGSSEISEDLWFAGEMSTHTYAIQFDRRNAKDLVFYDCDNDDFEKYMVKSMPGYTRAHGSYSDICRLCPAAGIAGVNISIGFCNEHRDSEWIDLLDFVRTVSTTQTFLKKKQESFEYVVRSWGYARSAYNQTTTTAKERDKPKTIQDRKREERKQRRKDKKEAERKAEQPKVTVTTNVTNPKAGCDDADFNSRVHPTNSGSNYGGVTVDGKWYPTLFDAKAAFKKEKEEAKAALKTLEKANKKTLGKAKKRVDKIVIPPKDDPNGLFTPPGGQELVKGSDLNLIGEWWCDDCSKDFSYTNVNWDDGARARCPECNGFCIIHVSTDASNIHRLDPKKVKLHPN